MTRTILALLIAVSFAAAQPAGGRGRGVPGGPGLPGGPRFIGAEAGSGRPVKGAPFSADAVTESVQVLPDGNRIRQSSSVRMYRDSEGRTRREQSLSALGSQAQAGDLPPVVFISDPVSGVNYALNSRDKTATRTQAMNGRGPWAGPGGRGARAEDRPAPQGARPAVAGGLRGRRQDPNVKTESLGKQLIEGVPAEGTRTTMLIPAGRIGNDQPLNVVSESWYSAELQMVVLSKRSDPRSGESTFRLTNINRGEPSRTLFDVPSDYKVNEVGLRGRGAAKQ